MAEETKAPAAAAERTGGETRPAERSERPERSDDAARGVRVPGGGRAALAKVAASTTGARKSASSASRRSSNNYKDIRLLSQFVAERGKIIPAA